MYRNLNKESTLNHDDITKLNPNAKNNPKNKNITYKTYTYVPRNVLSVNM